MEEGIIHIYYKEGVIIDEVNVKDVIAERISMAKGKPRPILVDTSKVAYWTKESKKYSYSKEAFRDMSAIAVINESLVAKIHINYGAKLFLPSIPIKVFSTISGGLKWLEKYK